MWMTGLILSMCAFSLEVRADDGQDWQHLIVAQGPGAKAARGAIVNALRLLPKLPARLAVIDLLEATPEGQAKLGRLDAFVVKGSAVVYVVLQSELLRGAQARSAFHTHALAGVLWHEMAHAGGADEREACRQEEALWASFVRDHRVETISGLRYLAMLAGRRDERHGPNRVSVH
jgi:hypothetical protein